ncbi:hypothetical protein [Streptomyces hokutonensis]|uniref:Uncharacterized protein n=1 Tax=Streptomyces hokutonensis TaxID=1306990 RepID=A0ABW6M9L8_9ACTN
MARTPKTRDDLPAPQTAKGQLFRYRPHEAAQWTPFSGRALTGLIARKEIGHVFNGRDNYLTGAPIVVLVGRYTAKPFTRPHGLKE